MTKTDPSGDGAKTPLRIAVDARSMGSRPSGIGIYLFCFLKHLAALGWFQIELLTDVAESEQMGIMRDMGIPVSCYGRKVFRSASVYHYFKFVGKRLRESRPNLFWEPNLLPVKLRGYGGKTVVTIHDLFPITEPEYFSPIYRMYFKRGIRKSVELAHGLVFNSMETQENVLKKIPAARGKKRFVSYLVLEPPSEKPISDDGFFLYIGNLEKRKGSDLLLKAYQSYWEKGGSKPLYLGGSIRDRDVERLLEQAQKRNPLVKYMGYLSPGEKEDWLSRCSCFVFPSRAEGFGLPPLEAMGYGKPVITSDLPIFRETLGGAAQTFGIGGSPEEQVGRLEKALFLHDAGGAGEAPQYQEVFRRYDAGRLAGQLGKFFLGLAHCGLARDTQEG